MGFKITAPVEGFTGRSTFGPVTLEFADGTAETDELSKPLRTYLERRGYTVKGGGRGKRQETATGETKPVDAGVPDGAPEESWTHAQLDAYAASRGVEFPANTTKTDKLAVLAEPADGGEHDDDPLGVDPDEEA